MKVKMVIEDEDLMELVESSSDSSQPEESIPSEIMFYFFQVYLIFGVYAYLLVSTKF